MVRPLSGPPKPLLCISVLVLLLLSWSRSCDHSPEKVQQAYLAIVKTKLENTITNITASLQSSGQPCGNHTTRTCTAERSDNVKIVKTLLTQACRMHRLKLPQMSELASYFQDSIGCLCKHTGKRTKEVTVRPGEERKARSRKSRHDRESQKLCKANLTLSSMTECYEMLNNSLDT